MVHAKESESEFEWMGETGEIPHETQSKRKVEERPRGPRNYQARSVRRIPGKAGFKRNVIRAKWKMHPMWRDESPLARLPKTICGKAKSTVPIQRERTHVCKSVWPC